MIHYNSTELERIALARLQPRASLCKLQMFKEINHLIDLYSNDLPSLQQAVSAMVIKKQTFAREALGSHVHRNKNYDATRQ